jgi:hypothetical protein
MREGNISLESSLSVWLIEIHFKALCVSRYNHRDEGDLDTRKDTK